VSTSTTAGNSAPSMMTRSVAPVSSPGLPPPRPVYLPPPTSPQVAPGTVVGGKRAVLVPTPFGTFVQWEDIGPSGSQAPRQTGGPNK
jgi:hypothetical protein